MYNYAFITRDLKKTPTILSPDTFLVESNLLIKNDRDKNIKSLNL